MTAVLCAFSLAADAGEAIERVRVQPGTARPGDAVLVTVHGAAHTPVGAVGTWKLSFLPFRSGHQALLGLPVDMKPGTLKVALQIDGEELSFDLDVVEPNFHHDELKVASKYVAPSPAERKWMAQDQRAFDAAFAQKAAPRLF